jgi:hypothetical protein
LLWLLCGEWKSAGRSRVRSFKFTQEVSSSEERKMWMDLGCVLEVEYIGFAGGFEK